MRDIVIGVDQSAASGHVLDRAMAEASSTHRPVRVLHAWSAPVWVGGPSAIGYASMPSSKDNSGWAKELADTMLARARDATPSAVAVDSSTEGPEGHAGDTLVRASMEAGLLVIGGPSHGGLAGALLGSTTSYALHHSTCPVMVVPTTACDTAFRRVIVGFDDSPCSRSALRWALDAAHRHNCPLVVVHALHLTQLGSQLPTALLYPDYEEGLKVWLDSEVASAKTGLDDSRLSTEVREGSASEVLMTEAGSGDLLVVGSRGHGGFASLMLGSVATQCAQHSRGVVVIVRAGNERLEDQQGLTAASVRTR